jgi:hypothetical protein
MSARKSSFNPFPDYPVTRLVEDPVQVGTKTIETKQVSEMRARIREWAAHWTEKGENAPSLVPMTISVRGDYGSGKTHLLLDGLNELGRVLKGASYTVVRVPAVETDPGSWYADGIAPQIAAAGLPDLMLQIYARAGEEVAAGTQLTVGGAQLLQENPKEIYRLVRGNLLDREAVDKEILRLLSDAGISSPEVRAALAGLVWSPTREAAMNWLTAKPIPQDQGVQLGVTSGKTEPETIAAILEGVASVHKLVDRPFVFIIDELEHLVQFDLSRNGRVATTWLKRLVEVLAAQGAMVILSGHWDAWLGQTDLRDRLPGLRPIELPVLKGADVIQICDTWVRSGAINYDQADLVVELTHGNRRKIVSLCRSLYQKTNGFETPLSLREIREASEEIAQKLTIDGAALAMLGILERLGLQAERPGKIRGVPFDLVGLRGGQPVVVVDIRHAITQVQQLAEANDFLEKTKNLPGLIGCFLSDGAVNPEVVPLFAAHGLQRFIYDLNQRDVVARIHSDVIPLLSSASEGGREQQAQRLSEESAKLTEKIAAAEEARDTEQATRLKHERELIEQQLEQITALYNQATTSLQDQLLKFEAKRAAEAADFQMQIEAAVAKLASPREQAVVKAPEEAANSPERSLFLELTRTSSSSERLKYAMSAQAIVFIGLALLLLLVTMLNPFEKAFFYVASYVTYKILLACADVAFVLASGWEILRRVSEFDQREQYRTRLLHEMYVRQTSASDLLRADNIIRNSFDQNPRWKARDAANEALAREFPEVYGYLSMKPNSP